MNLIVRVCRGVASRWRAIVLRARGARLAERLWLQKIEVPRQAHRVSLGEGVALDRGVVLLVSGSADAPPSITIGEDVYINRHTIIDSCESISIGSGCMLGPFCYLTDHDHVPGPDGRPGSGSLRSRPVRLEPNCWIGAHVTILKGVTIGAGAVVGAGSVVTKDVAPGFVVVGNPARALKRTS